MIFEVHPPSTSLTEDIRFTFRQRMGKLYSGWSDSFDRQFDHHSFLFVIRDGCDGEFLATCRLIFKYKNEITYLTPMEMGDVSRFVIPSSSQFICEGGMVSFTSRNAVLELMYGVCNWMMENGIEQCYTTYDTKNSLIKRLYTRTLKFSVMEGKVVQFSEFKSRENGLPVEWQVVAGNPQEKGAEVLNQLRANGTNLHYENGKHSSLTDWLTG